MSYSQHRRSGSRRGLRLPPSTTAKTNWNEAMIRNTQYLAWAKIQYPAAAKKFVLAGDVDAYRAKLGLKQRPKQFRVDKTSTPKRKSFTVQLIANHNFHADNGWALVDRVEVDAASKQEAYMIAAEKFAENHVGIDDDEKYRMEIDE